MILPKALSTHLILLGVQISALPVERYLMCKKMSQHISKRACRLFTEVCSIKVSKKATDSTVKQGML